MEVCCIASGPSLTVADVDLVARWRAAAADRRVIVCNTSFRLAPWADVLYARDERWWKSYGDEAAAAFEGELLCYGRDEHSTKHARSLMATGKFSAFGNTGAGAIALAVGHMGAGRIVLLGYDCAKTGGRVHWHGDHPKGMSNARSLRVWPLQFQRVAARFRRVEIINASRQSALTCFKRMPLELALGKINGTHLDEDRIVVGSAAASLQ